MIRQMWPLVCAAALGLACTVAPSISGAARVIDGDSLEIGETRIRLHAVDAPEARQTCGAAESAWPCGAAATARLRELAAGRLIACTPMDVDDYGRTVAVCHNGEVDLGAALVDAGLARAYRRFGDDYVREEAAARAARRGLWSGPHVPPWEWRSREAPRGGIAGAAPGRSECRIKGNISSAGDRIYHMPGSGAYAQTVIDETRGERWFCSEEEAQRAGWRPPRGPARPPGR